VAAHFREDGLLKQDLDHKNQEFTDRFLVRLFDGIDTSRFRDGVDIAKATNIIHWTLDGFANQLSVRVKSLPLGAIDTDSIIAEMDELFCLLKTGLYK
jgi:hypothetical protein